LLGMRLSLLTTALRSTHVSLPAFAALLSSMICTLFDATHI
jgi:hypothetical protein